MHKVLPALKAMASEGVLLLVHGEVTDPEVDMFDREAVFIKEKLVSAVGGVHYLEVDIS
jgi:dihydroorotase